MRQGLMEEDTETICKQLGVVLPEVNEALQYQPNTKSLQDVMYTSASGGKEEILLEDMLEDTQAIHKMGEVEDHMVFNHFTKHRQARIDLCGICMRNIKRKKLGIEWEDVRCK